MKTDMVFTMQEAFRKLLHAYSYPGEIVSFYEQGEQLPITANCMKATQVLMYMLLDADTNFHMVTQDQELIQQFSQLTYCLPVTLEEANFVFLMEDERAQLNDALEHCSIGTLEDPHMGATLIIECESITNETEMILKGPGIQHTNNLHIAGLREGWQDIREACNREYPMGIDMICIDASGNCVVLPRTTQIERDQTWHM